MANKKIIDLPADVSPALTDLIETVDVSDLTDSPQGSSKQVQLGNLPFAADNHNHDADYAALVHTHAAADIITGTFANGRISQASVVQHQGALTLTKSQISDFGSYANVSHNHDASALTTGTLVDARVAQSNVTQHQAALAIDDSQVAVNTSGVPATGTDLETIINQLCYGVSEGGGTDRIANVVSCTSAEYALLTPKADTLYALTD